MSQGRHSAKNLYNFFPEIVCRVSALGKEFLFLLKKSLCRVPWPDTRQNLPLCRVPWPDTRQILPLCRVPWPDTRQSLPICRVLWPDTRQRAQFCRVSLQLHSAKLENLVFSSSFCQLCRVQWLLHSAKRPLPSVTLGKASIIAYFFLFLHSNTSITHSNRKFHRYSSHSSNP